MRITRKGRVTIPAEVCEQAGLLLCTEVEFSVRHGGAAKSRKIACAPQTAPDRAPARQGHPAHEHRRDPGPDPRLIRVLWERNLAPGPARAGKKIKKNPVVGMAETEERSEAGEMDLQPVSRPHAAIRCWPRTDQKISTTRSPAVKSP